MTEVKQEPFIKQEFEIKHEPAIKVETNIKEEQNIKDEDKSVIKLEIKSIKKEKYLENLTWQLESPLK